MFHGKKEWEGRASPAQSGGRSGKIEKDRRFELRAINREKERKKERWRNKLIGREGRSDRNSRITITVSSSQLFLIQCSFDAAHESHSRGSSFWTFLYHESVGMSERPGYELDKGGETARTAKE